MTFLFSSRDVLACENQNNEAQKEMTTKKSCCSSESSTDKKQCCCSDSEKSDKETKKCDGSCKHNGCNSTTTSTVYLKSNDYFPLSPLTFDEEDRNMWRYSQPKINPVYLAIWQPPKI